MSRVLYFISVSLLFSCGKEEVNPNILVFGHAGATLNNGEWIFPPNSKEAVQYGCFNLGANGAEIDVQMTKDSVLVLYHDEFLSPQLDLEGCIAEYTWNELEGNKIYDTKYPIQRLYDMRYMISDRPKYYFLDLKHHNACNSEIRDPGTFSYALNSSDLYWKRTVLNSRNLPFLLELSVDDTNVIKSWETDDLAQGIVAVQNGAVDELTLRASNLTETDAAQLHELGIPFTIFGARTQKELREAVALNPTRIITDNIAYTNKITM
ncbi:MAG: hypothetical protein MK078_17190 [Crocinitomicaceae bacterium]|nr:hypothetical protein [Crocinitomicaceae bacterium]